MQGSQHEQDELVWQSVGLRLGTAGLDLRQPSEPTTLAKLINARFLDERTVRRRDGHTGQLIRDASNYPSKLDVGDINQSIPQNPGDWVYGHGRMVDTSSPLATPSDHFPIPFQAKGTFNYDGADVVWTGDRLLVARPDDAQALGQSKFWDWFGGGATSQKWGIPAFLPVQTDSTPPDTVSGDYVETCLTDSFRVTVAVIGSTLTAWVTSRATGALVDKSTLGGDSNPCNPRVFQSGAYVMCVWRDNVTNKLYTNYWSGDKWNGASTTRTGVGAFDVAPVAGGFHMFWREGTALYVGKYSGHLTQSSPYPFATAITVTTPNGNPNGVVGIAVQPNDRIALCWQVANALNAKTLNPDATDFSSQGTLGGSEWTGALDGAITVSSRTLSHTQNFSTHSPNYRVVVHASSGGNTYIFETDGGGGGYTEVRYNSVLASRSFVVGNAVFCWLRATNSQTLYLIAGVVKPQVCGYADVEEAKGPTISGGAPANGLWPTPMVVADPLDSHAFTWARPYSTGQSYSRAGNTRIGDMQFLPALSVAQYGKSVYLAGSHVRNWDGQELGDAGFHNYPTVKSLVAAAGGSLTAGDKRYLVYAVRYNKRGERFMSPAVVSSKITVTASQKVTVTINTLPDTNHDDVIFEVYTTTAGGSAFFLEGTVANSFAAATVTFVSTMADASLALQPGDSHAVASLGIAGDLLESGPTGCAILAVAHDRLWGAGGQVPAGQVEFSKLKEDGEGVGFDVLGDYQTVDSEGGTVTSIVGYNDAVYIFEAGRFYVLGGDGPNNEGAGAFSIPQLVLADGAISHAGTITTQLGVVYWGADGPRLLTNGFRVQNICTPVRPLTSTLTPTGVRVDLSRQEVVWYTSGGDAVLWNYAADTSRWAQWSGLYVAGCSDASLVTTDGWLLKESADALGDAGKRFAFVGSTGELRAEDLLGGAVSLYAVGIAGAFKGDHDVRLRIFYNGAPCWSEEFEWKPQNKTWLDTIDNNAGLTPAQVDALKPTDRSGAYGTHKRVKRNDCRFFRVEWSDIGSLTDTFVPYEITLELGSRNGLGRVPVNKFGS